MNNTDPGGAVISQLIVVTLPGCPGNPSYENGTDGASVVENSIRITGGIDTDGQTAVTILSQGGGGGSGFGIGRGGNGGSAGLINLTIDPGVSLESNGTAIQITATGGAGGAGPVGESPNIPSTAGSGASSNSLLSLQGYLVKVDDGVSVAASILSQGGEGAYGVDGSHIGGFGGNGGSFAIMIGKTALITTGGDGLVLETIGGAGGTGANSSGGTSAHGIPGGYGGNGGTPSLTSSGMIAVGGTGLRVSAAGGAGGAATDALGNDGGNGGVGGGGGSARAEIAAGSINASYTGLYVTAEGGAGGDGGLVQQGFKSKGGSGGTGGDGGAVIAKLDRGALIATTSDATFDERSGVQSSVPALWVHANGGTGGKGGDSEGLIGTGGGGGKGGNGGVVTTDVSGLITTIGTFAYGALAQSIGGSGGNGNTAFGFLTARGGAAANGGDGGAVTLTGDGGPAATSATLGSITTQGLGAAAVIAQSIGGGGGAGGNAYNVALGTSVSLGGAGGLGGNGGVTDLTMATTIVTNGNKAPALTAQSIGGGGGFGGSAVAIGVPSIFTLAIGGMGQSGGAGAASSVTNGGLLTTFGEGSGGATAQSIGGGGGSGGAAMAHGLDVVLAIDSAVGGSGGSGGQAGTATATSNMQITTYGSDAHALKAQSVAGGGGDGGIAIADALAIWSQAAGEEVPSLAEAISIGGSGSAGGTAGEASVTNNAFIATAGNGSVAMLGQSIAGGGGNGGDSAAFGAAFGGTTNIGLTLALGGNGGSGGRAGNVDMTNNALILTTGESAYGMLGQSIAGGGGQGSLGDASGTTMKGDGFTININVGMAGLAGWGGAAANVELINQGGILTEGDGAIAMLGQSIGGGGGAGGGGAAKADASKITIGVSVGSRGGSGGNGASATLTNYQALQTLGASAAGMVVQSIGGGGGTGGKANSTTGGSETPIDLTDDLLRRIGASFGTDKQAESIADKVYVLGDGVLKDLATASSLSKIASKPSVPADGNNGIVGTLTMALAIGGAGGIGGNGGTAEANNFGSIVTQGAASDGILAQSIGGGGGLGGGTSASSPANPSQPDTIPLQLSVGRAGAGGAAGNGGQMTVNAAAGSNIQTKGDSSNGVVAQSIGGGGGKGGVSATLGGLGGLTVAIGGSDGSSGNGGTVSINHDVNTTIATAGNNAIGVLAQSIGGGGGVANVMRVDKPAGLAASPATPDGFAFNFYFNGNGGSSGTGGTVIYQDTLSNGASGAPTGSISTTGRNAFGILAQSIGGGGGLATGGSLTNQNVFDYQGSLGHGGDGGAVTVDLLSAVSTTGDGAVGIFAQSIGGGGGIAGDGAASTGRAALSGSGQAGNGGIVTVTVEQGAKVTTAGANAPAILIQSIGGGGGYISANGTTYSSTLGAPGNSGAVNLTVKGAASATGIASSGVRIETASNAAFPTLPGVITVDVGSAGVVTGGTDSVAGNHDAAALYIASSQANGAFITIDGTVGNSSGKTAIYTKNTLNVIVGNGTILGDIVSISPSFGRVSGLADSQTGSAASASEFRNNGVWSGAMIDLCGADTGNCRVVNNGTIHLRGNAMGAVTFSGNYTGAGRIVFNADFAKGVSDTLGIGGTAVISGQIEVRSRTMRNLKLPLINAAGGLTINPMLAVSPTENQLFAYKFDTDGATLYVTPQARLAAQAAGLGGAREAAARQLQTMFERGERFDAGFTALANLSGPADYARTLGNLTGETLGGIAAYRYQTGRRFIGDVNRQCLGSGDEPCAWARVQAGRSTQDPTADALGYRARYQLFELGGQRRIADGFFISGAAAYEHASLRDEDRTARITGDGVLAAASLRYRAGAFDLIGSIDGSYGWYDSRRQIAVGSTTSAARATPRLWSLGLDVTASYRLSFGNAYVTPFVAARGTNVHSNAFVESSSSAFALDVLGQSAFAISGTAGISAGAKLSLGDKASLTPFVSAAVQITGDTNWLTRARFANSTSPDYFSVETRAPGTFGDFDIGLKLAIGSKLDLVLSYDPELGSNYRADKGVVRLNWRF